GARSEPDGRFTLFGATAVPHLLRVAGDEYAANPVALVPAPDAPPLELRARRGTRVTFDDADGFPLFPTIFEITPAAGMLVDSRWGLGTRALLPGKYGLTVFRDEVELAACEFEVGAAPIHVKIPPFAGPFRDQDEAPVRDDASRPCTID